MAAIQYDNCGRMKYNPEFHFNHGKPYTTQEMAYICQKYTRGNRVEVSMATGRTESTIATLICRLKQEGLFETYKNMNI